MVKHFVSIINLNKSREYINRHLVISPGFIMCINPKKKVRVTSMLYILKSNADQKKYLTSYYSRTESSSPYIML